MRLVSVSTWNSLQLSPPHWWVRCLFRSPQRHRRPSLRTPTGTPDANALYTSAVGAFDRSDYQGAVTSINALLAQIPPNMPPADKERLTAQLEPIYFTLGAAYYNLKDWGAAGAAFKDYLSRYPAWQPGG